MRKVVEKLPTDELYSQLQNKACVLEKILAQKKKALENAPEGSLRVSICNKNKQFYWVKKDEGKNGAYIPHSKMDFARQLAQKEYDDDEYSREWLQIPYQKKEIKVGQKSFPTSGGLLVRSKSEVIIAEMLEKNGIPFRYEQKLQLSAFNVHPDFVCLNVRTRQEFAWEHLGMLDDSDYSKMAAEKLHFYQKSGYFPGKNLIITTETQNFPLSSESVQEVIEQYLQ